MTTDWHGLLDEERYVSVDGTEVHYFDRGEGKPLVLVHGGELISCAELNWGAVLERFASHCRVVAPDQPGFGFTDPRGPEDHDPSTRAELLIEFIEALDLTDVTLAGNSMGGFIVSYIAFERPDLVERIVLVNSGAATRVRTYGQEMPSTKVSEPTMEKTRERAERYRDGYFVTADHHPFWRELTDEKIERLHEIERRNWKFNNERDEALRASAHVENTTLSYDGKRFGQQPERFDLPVMLAWSTTPIYSVELYDESESGTTGEGPDVGFEFFKQVDGAEMHVWHDAKHHVMTDQAPGFVDVVSSFMDA